MAVLAKTYMDIVDLYKHQDNKGELVDVVEMLHMNNPVMQDALWMECNSGKTHLTTVRTGLAQAAWGRYYKGTPNSTGATAQVTDSTGFVEARATVDVRLVDGNKNGNVIRLNEAEVFLETIRQELNTKFFYGNDRAEPDQFMGLAPRFSDPTAPNGKQIIDGGGSGSRLTSIWIITWGDNTCHLLYPENAAMGVTRKDHGAQRVLDDVGNAFYAYEETFTQHIGATVRDWRYVVRIANIDLDELEAGNVDIYALLRKAYYQHRGRSALEGGSMGRTVVYARTEIIEAMDAANTNSGASDNFVRLKMMEVEGQEVETWRKFPIRDTEALKDTEEQVTGFPA